MGILKIDNYPLTRQNVQLGPISEPDKELEGLNREQYKNKDQPNTGLGTTAGKRAEAGSREIFPSRRKFYLILYKFIVSDKSVARPFCDGLRCRLSPKLKKQSK